MILTALGQRKILPEIPVNAFNGLTYSGISGSSDATGQVVLWLPEGSYRFRADQYALHFWSDEVCEVPGCDFIPVYTYSYGSDPREEVEIVYTYDALNRLTGAEYSSRIYFHYTYDAAGNRLSQNINLGSEPVVTEYSYDEANRLVQEGEQTYTWDNTGRVAPLRRRSSPPIRSNLLAMANFNIPMTPPTAWSP